MDGLDGKTYIMLSYVTVIVFFASKMQYGINPQIQTVSLKKFRILEDVLNPPTNLIAGLFYTCTVFADAWTAWMGKPTF